MHRRRSDPAWYSDIRPVQSPRLQDGSEWVMKSFGSICLTVRVEQFRAKVPFHMVQKIAVHCLLLDVVYRSSCKDYPTKTSASCVLPFSLCLHHLSTLSYQAKNISYLVSKDGPRTIRTARKVSIPPMTQAKLQAKCPAKSLALCRTPRNSLPNTSHC